MAFFTNIKWKKIMRFAAQNSKAATAA